MQRAAGRLTEAGRQLMPQEAAASGTAGLARGKNCLRHPACAATETGGLGICRQNRETAADWAAGGCAGPPPPSTDSASPSLSVPPENLHLLSCKGSIATPNLPSPQLHGAAIALLPSTPPSHRPHHVPERPPTVHACRGRRLCRRQGRRGECPLASTRADHQCHPPTPAAIRKSPAELNWIFGRGLGVVGCIFGGVHTRCVASSRRSQVLSSGLRLTCFSAPGPKCRTRRRGHAGPNLRRRHQGLADRGLLHSRAANSRCPGGVWPR